MAPTPSSGGKEPSSDAASKEGDFRSQLAQDALGGDDLHRSQRAVVRECGNNVRDLEFMENQDVIDDEEAGLGHMKNHIEESLGRL